MAATLEAMVTVLGAAAVAPPLLYLLTLTFFDKRPEPAYAVVGTFLLGALSTSALHVVSPAAGVLGGYVLEALQFLLGDDVSWLQSDRSVATLLQSVIDIAIPEETLKVLILLLFSRRFLAYDHPMEGVVYGAAVGLGLAAYENLLLAVHLTDAWREHAVIRSILTVPTHGALGVIAGVYVARAKFGKVMRYGHGTSRRWRSYAGALFVPILLHTLYNYPLLLVRSMFGIHAPFAPLLQTAGFVVGTVAVLLAARLVYRIVLAQGGSTGRYGKGSLYGYRAWRLDVLGAFASLLGSLMVLIEVRAAWRGDPFVWDRHIGVFVGAILVAIAAFFHRRAVSPERRLEATAQTRDAAKMPHLT